MLCRIREFRNKDVINISDGTNYGKVCDMEFDTKTATLLSIVVFGKRRFFGMLGRDNDIVITWDDIEIIGQDTILVKSVSSPPARSSKFSKFGEFIFR